MAGIYGNIKKISESSSLSKDEKNVIYKIQKILFEENKKIYGSDRCTEYFNLSLIERINSKLASTFNGLKYTRYYTDKSYASYGGKLNKSITRTNIVSANYFIHNNKLYLIYLLLDGDKVKLYDYLIHDVDYYIFGEDIIRLAIDSLVQNSLFILDFQYNNIYSSRIDGLPNKALFEKIEKYVQEKYKDKLESEIDIQSKEIRFKVLNKENK